MSLHQPCCLGFADGALRLAAGDRILAVKPLELGGLLRLVHRAKIIRLCHRISRLSNAKR